MLRRVHPLAATLGLLTMLTFWTSTVAVELFATESDVIRLKRILPWGLLLLVPALAVTGATGWLLSRGATSRLITAKARRMPFIAANGLLVLTPCVLALDHLASNRNLGTSFVALQTLELVAGAANLTLMSLNARDGLQLRSGG